MAEFSPKLKEALSLVQKPGRYTGGEPGCTYKDKANVPVRAAQPPRKLVVRASLYALGGHERADGAPAYSALLPGKQGPADGFRYRWLLLGIRALLYQYPCHAGSGRHSAARCGS